MVNRFRSVSLKTRVLLLVVALFFAGIWGLAARVTATLQADLEKLLSDQLSTSVGYVAAEIDSSFRYRVDVLNKIAASITPDILTDPAKVQRLIESHSISIELFGTGLFVANKEAIIIAEYPHVPGRAGGSVSGIEYFQHIMAGAKEAFGKLHQVGRFSKRPLVAVGVPLRDASGGTVGMLAGTIFPSDPQLFGILEQAKIGRGGYILVISPAERVIVSSSNNIQITQPLPAKGMMPLLDRRLDEGFEGAGITVNTLGVEVLSVSRKIMATGWIVIAAVPTDEIFGPISTLKRQIYLIALLMSLVMAVILRFVLLRQLRPLEDAGAAIRRMTDGKEPLAPIPITREDEIGRLVGDFNRLITERKRLDETLKESEHRFRAIFESVHLETAILDVQGNVVFCNQTLLELTGWKSDEVIGKNWFRTFRPPEQSEEHLARFLARIVDGSVPLHYEGDIISRDGRRFEISWSHTLMHDVEGRVVGVASIGEDVTERSRAEVERARLAAIVENSNDAIIGRTLDGTITSWNLAAERLYGYTAAEAIGRDLTQIVPPDQQREVAANREAIAQGKPVPIHETVRYAKDGRQLNISFSVSPIKDIEGTVIGISAIARDITPQKQAEAQLRLAASVFDGAAEGIMITDKDDNIVSVNRAFTEITGYSAQEVVRQNYRVLWSDRQTPEFYEQMWASISKSGRWKGEIWDRRKDGEPYCELLSINAVRNDQGEVMHYCAIFSDITQRKMAETELAQLNAELESRVAQRGLELAKANKDLETANRELEAFSFSVSHDLRAPLRVINGFSSLILNADQSKLDQNTVECLKKINAGSIRMGELIDDLLSLSRISRQTMRRHELDLSALADKVVHELREVHSGRPVQVTVQPDMRCNGDAGLIRIVLDNLIGNAWKFTARTEEGRIEVGAEVCNGEPVYYVRDNGAGFDMLYANKLFQAFQRLHGNNEFEGTGIGLSIVQRIIARHGGRVWAEAKVGQGATFRFTLL